MPSTKETTVLSERGQTQVPAWVRERLGLVAGQKLVWEVVGDQDIRVHVVPATSEGRRARWRGIAKSRLGSNTDKVMNTLRQADRKSRKAIGL